MGCCTSKTASKDQPDAATTAHINQYNQQQDAPGFVVNNGGSTMLGVQGGPMAMGQTAGGVSLGAGQGVEVMDDLH